ncbi:MAG: hypothetical protein E2P05_07220 [Acidobacteria bacterium]|nr:MAG: hypothetical protein E2P05_07220 [Acidobacteriota bacterium]
MPGVTTSAVPCPRCRFGGVNDNFLKNREGAFFTYCDAGHQFNDTTDMQTEVARADAKFGKPKVVQTSVPAKPDPSPEEKKAAATREFTGQVLVVDQENRDRIQKILGVNITGPADLYGAIFSMKEELKAAKSAAPQEAPPGQGPLTLRKDQIVINLPEWCAESFKDFAQGMGIPIEEFANQQFEEYLRSLYVETDKQKVG